MSNVPTGDSSAFSGYLNMMIKLFIGICAVLAVIMIVVGGIEYMTSELISSKEAGKERIRNAIFGLLLALGAWTLLNAINPNLLDSSLKNLTSVTVTVTADQANFAATEQTTASVGTGYKLSGTPSSGVTDFANNSCSSLSKVTVNTATKQASFCSRSSCVSVPVNLGYKGVAEVGQAKSGDSKTPKGTFTTSGDIRLGNSGNAVISNNGYNLGAAFVNIGAKDSSGNDRGIGFHGNEQDTLGTTNGCIRMSNDDLTLLAPCIKTGTTISII